MAEITSAKAMARTVRVSPRKSRLVLDNIRGKDVADAIAILKFTPNKAAGIIEKVLNSAIANAENNFGLEKANLVNLHQLVLTKVTLLTTRRHVDKRGEKHGRNYFS